MSTETLNKVYNEYAVKPVYDPPIVIDPIKGRKLVGFEQVGEPIRTLSMTPDRAEIYNAQSENISLRLYEVE